MAWTVTLPEDAVVGEEGHVEAHNAIRDAILELRDAVDGKAAAVTTDAAVWIGTLEAYQSLESTSETTIYFIRG